jgi:hypothetical protein
MHRSPVASYLSLLIMPLLLCGLALAQPSNPARGDLRLVILGDINGSFGSTEYSPRVMELAN